MEIKKILAQGREVPENYKKEFFQKYDTGFTDWQPIDYQQFIKGFKKHAIQDVQGIAAGIDSKDEQQVNTYISVFMERYTELRDKDQIIKRLKQRQLESKHLKVLHTFEDQKYCILLQENLYDNRKVYSQLILQAQQDLEH